MSLQKFLSYKELLITSDHLLLHHLPVLHQVLQLCEKGLKHYLDPFMNLL